MCESVRLPLCPAKDFPLKPRGAFDPTIVPLHRQLGVEQVKQTNIILLLLLSCEEEEEEEEEEEGINNSSERKTRVRTGVQNIQEVLIKTKYVYASWNKL